MVARETLQELQVLLQQRQIRAGIELLDHSRGDFTSLAPGVCCAGLALGTLARWVDVGFEGEELLAGLLQRFPPSSCAVLPVGDYVQLCTAKAVLAMRRENLTEALRYLDLSLTITDQLEDLSLKAIASLWKARCLRKSAEYAQALEVARHGIAIALQSGTPYLGAVMRTLESWLVFQMGETKEAIVILQEAEAVLRDTDDFITLGNIQSTYGRIALREARYDHAIKYFEASIDLFKRRRSLEGYLARSLTNIAQAKRFAAMQLRRSIDAQWERQRVLKAMDLSPDKRDKAGQLERLHDLLRNAQSDLGRADEIYRRLGHHHGVGNVDVNLAQIYLDLGELDEADVRAKEAFDLAASKADHLLMCRARIVQALVANARYEEQIGEEEDPSRFAQLAHDCAKEAIAFGERTESRRLLAQAHLCYGLTFVNGFFNNTDAARACCDRAENYLGNDRHDALWQEIELLRSKILHAGIEDPNLRAWSQGVLGDKSLQAVVSEFEEMLIRKVWEHEGRKVSRVAHRLAVSPKKVRRVLRHLGLHVEPA